MDRYDNLYPAPATPRPPVTLQVRQGRHGGQVVTLWVSPALEQAGALRVRPLVADAERPMWLDVDTDIMGAAVVPLETFEVRIFGDDQQEPDGTVSP